MTESDAYTSAIPATTEEVTPLELQVTLGGNSREAATTSVEPTGLHLDSSFINKTSLKAISSLGTRVYPVFTGSLKGVSHYEERSPQYQEKGASVVNVWSTLPTSTTDKTTASGKSDDLINLGDGLRYLELKDRIEKLDTSVAEI